MQLFNQWLLTLAMVVHRVWHIVARMVRQQRRQAAQGLVEYALILVLIAVVVIGTLTGVGRRVSTVYQQVNCGLAGAQGATTCLPATVPCTTVGASSTCPPGHNP